MSVGYSKHTLIEKLGIKPFTQTAILNAPEDYIDMLGKLPLGTIIEGYLQGKYTLIQYFVTWREDLEKEFPNIAQHIYPTSCVWISWPKKSSGQVTNLTENVIRTIGLKNGMVDVKVIAVDEIWSGLKFVIRLKDRDKLK